MSMYNYFMLIGKVEKIEKDDSFTLVRDDGYGKYYITLKVKRDYGIDYDLFKVVYIGNLDHDFELSQKNIMVKGRLLQTSNLEIIAEKIICFEDGKWIRN